MRTPKDLGGQVVNSKRIRQGANLKSVPPMDIQRREGRNEIKPAPVTVRMVGNGPMVIAVAKDNAKVLTSQIVEKTRESLRTKRSKRAGK